MDDCIEWQGAKTSSGYGQRQINGRHTRVHRKAWADVHGPIPPGMFVLHRCDNPPCYNINHLFLGTAQDNSDDCKAKGRSRKGIPSGRKGISMPKPRLTHCQHGHALTDDNVYVAPKSGIRNCLTCKRRRQREYRSSRLPAGMVASEGQAAKSVSASAT